MTSNANDSSSQVLPQGENASFSGPLAGPPEHQSSRARNQVFKSGSLFISSKGIGWTSWKKRWFILTRTSLVFFRSDPSAAPQKGGEVNLTLGGIDLNNSASVEVKVDKKLLTVFFPDGRDGRAFTLKAETSEELHEWKTALENAIQLSPIITHGSGQNGLLKSEQTDDANGSSDQQKDNSLVVSMVIGRPILLALEDIDGSPSFLEKALRFVEDHGVKVEGILRQAADVDDVHRRVREYEQGKTEFSAEEDAHVIGDCIKYILRELPSSPVPASCCNALLEAFRTDRNNRLNAMRTAILETFPEPNRRLLQRILSMMQIVVSNKTVNRMSTSAVAACMSPLLLRPLLAGDCELENTHMDVAGDGSLQLLQAAAAANHAQAIIITLLDEYDNIFGEGSMSAALFSSDESGTGTEEATDDGTYDEDDDDDYDDDDASDDHEYGSDDHEEETNDDSDHLVTETGSESGDHAESDSYDEKPSRSSSFTGSPERANNHLAKSRSTFSSPTSPVSQEDNIHGAHDNIKRNNDISMASDGDIIKQSRHTNIETSSGNDSASPSPKLDNQMSSTKFLGSSQVRRQRWGRTSAKKNLSMESIDFTLEEEDDEIQQLEATKINLQNRITEEANGNVILQASLETRKKAIHERRLALEKDVARLEEQLQKEKDLRAALEDGSNISRVRSFGDMSVKTKNDLQEFALEEQNFNNLKQRFDDLGTELNLQHELNAALLHDKILEIHGTSSQRRMLMNNMEYVSKGTSSHSERSVKDCAKRNNTMDGDNDHETEWSNETSLSYKKQSQSNDSSRGGLPKFGWLPNNSSSDSSAAKPNPATSKKSSSKGEGGSSNSALSKLTNRLNFLKERRNQIASELQFIDKSKGFSNQPALSPGKGKAPELPIIHSSDKDDHSHQSTQSSEGDNKDSNKKSDTKKNSNSSIGIPSSYSLGKWMSNEGEKKEGDSNKISSNSISDVISLYKSGRGMMNGGEKKDNKRNDEKRSSNPRSDITSSNSSGKGTPSKNEKTEGYNKEYSNKKKDDKTSSSSRSDAPPSDNYGKGISNDGENKDNDKKTMSPKDDNNDYNKKTEKKGGNKKGFFSSKTNVDQGRKSENQSGQHLDRVKLEAQSSKSSDKGRQQDGQLR